MNYSKLWVLFHHPIKVIKTWLLLMLGFSIFCLVVNIEFPSGFMLEVAFAIAFFIALCMKQRYYNKNGDIEDIDIEPQPRRKKNHGLVRFLVSSASSANQAYDRKQKNMEDALTSSLTGFFSSRPDTSAAQRRAAQQKADAEAFARWTARDRQKKAEYDARDAALRGKDRAAYQYQQQADYWYNESKR